MRRKSFTGPLVLLLIGGLFLWRNLHPEAPIFEIVSQYWPFVLIGWGLLRLIEVMVWPETRHGGFTGGEVVLVILICMAGSLTWAARDSGIRFNTRGLDWWGQQYDYPVSGTAPATGITRVVFENSRGNIKVIGADTHEITVTGHKTIRSYGAKDAERTNGNTPLELITQGDHLLIRSNQDRALDNQQISDELEVTVPHALAVESRSVSGDCEVADVTSDVELSASRGDVRLTRVGGNVRLDMGRSDLIRIIDLKGRLDIRGRGSDLELENIGGQVTINGAYNGTLEFKRLAKPLQFEGARSTELSVQAVPGHITMDLGSFNGSDLVGPTRLVANSRDVRMELFTQSLELETTRGDIELHPGRVPLGAIEARSSTGRIDIALPEKGSFVMDATVEHGEAYSDYGPQLRQESEGRTATIKGKVGEGPTIHLTSGRGRIAVRKEGTSAPSSSDETPQKQAKDGVKL